MAAVVSNSIKQTSSKSGGTDGSKGRIICVHDHGLFCIKEPYPSICANNRLIGAIEQGWKKCRTMGPLVPEKKFNSQKIIPKEK